MHDSLNKPRPKLEPQTGLEKAQMLRQIAQLGNAAGARFFLANRRA
jgi:hypothetical protein